MASFRDAFKKLFADVAQSSVSIQFPDGVQVRVSKPDAKKPEQGSRVPAVSASEQPTPAVSLPVQLPSCTLPRSEKLSRLAELPMQDKARACLAKLGETPTEALWTMILSPTVSTNVIAGAGSGKSTTLILRILILHKLLGISLDALHVFSFTRASTQEFQGKLKDKLALWEEKVEGKTPTNARKQDLEEQVKRTASTFHRSLLVFVTMFCLPEASHANFLISWAIKPLKMRLSKEVIILS